MMDYIDGFGRAFFLVGLAWMLAVFFWGGQ